MTSPIERCFGAVERGVVYRPRPGVYGVALRAGPSGLEVLAVEDAGGIVLPGGGAEAGEADAEVLMREAIEEAGCVVSVGACLGRVARIERRAVGGWVKLCAFYRMEVVETLAAPTEPGNRPFWERATLLAERLRFPNDRWALARAAQEPASEQSAPSFPHAGPTAAPPSAPPTA